MQNSRQAEAKPVPGKLNIIFLFPDQLRADFLGCYGADWLDRLVWKDSEWAVR